MPVNEALLAKLKEAFAVTPHVKEMKMFGGIAFMVNNKLCITVGKDRIMCRVDPAVHDALVQKPGCSTVIMKHKEYKGYIWINESSLKTKKQMDYWVKLALHFNTKAKAATKKNSAKNNNTVKKDSKKIN